MEVHEDSHLNIFRRNSVSNRAYTATKRNRSINKGSLRQASLIAKSELWSSIQAGDLSRVMSIIDVDPNECESTRGSEGN